MLTTCIKNKKPSPTYRVAFLLSISPNEFTKLCDVQIAQTLRPNCLRAKYGKSSLLNAVHCTDSPEDGVLECQYFFQTLG